MKPYNTLFIAFTLFQITFNLVSYPMGASNDNTWDPSWSFYKEIKLNVDTSDPGFHYQPVDIHVTFSNTCWALDEKNHSIRVMVYHDNRWDELESQIYNLSFIDDSHIKECNLVFLIPSYADGNERYYLYYDDEEKPSPSYQDHVSIKEETFYYEPITGYKADLRYYKIIDDGYCLYGVGLGGELIGLETVHKIIKQKNDATVFSPRNWVQMASFAFFYAVEGTTGVGTDEVLVSKDILVDGNLMVRFKISSKSSNGKLETDAAYTYYHCPTSEKRIIVDVSHRVVETAFSTGSAAQGGSFGYLASSKTRSVNIRELNSGFIPPYVHFFSEEQTIREYSLPQNPHSSDYEWVLSPKDDTDLGSRPWVSLDEGSEGYAYALILSSSTGLYSMGRDGVQIEAGSEEFINVPGFEMDGSGVSIGRNSVEPGEEEELTLPAGLEIRFSAEFFTTEEGGYPRVDRETMVFQMLEKQNVRGEGESRAVGEVEGEYALTVIPSLQGVSRPLLAAAFASPIPTVEVQLHKEGSLVAAGLASRSPLIRFTGDIPNVKGVKDLFTMLPSLFKTAKVDIANATVLQQVTFPHLSSGTYLVKVFLNTGERSKYIGYKIVDVDKDMVCTVFCRPEGKIKLELVSQTGNGVSGAVVQMVDGSVCIAENITNKEGETEINFPIASYKLKVLYKGFNIHEETVKPLSSFLSFRTRRIVLPLFDLTLKVKDNLSLPFTASIVPLLTSQDMEKNTKIKPTYFKTGEYQFTGLPEGRYLVFLKYKSFTLEQTVDVERETVFSVKIPLSYAFELTVVDERGFPVTGAEVLVKRENVVLRETTSNDGSVIFLLPPGEYFLEVRYNEAVLARQPITISSDEKLTIATAYTPLYIHLLFIAIFAVGVILFLMIILKRLDLRLLFIVLSVILLFSAVLLPIWTFEGRHSKYHVSSNIFILPSSFITLKQAGDLKTGETAELPEVFTTSLQIILFLVLLDIIALVFMVIVRKNKVKGALHCLSLLLSFSLIVITYLLLSELTTVTLGSIAGEGFVEFSMPDGETISMFSLWHLGAGWFFFILSTVCLVFYITLIVFRRKD